MSDLRPRCKATARSGVQCQLPALPGLAVCRSHGGGTPRSQVVAERARTEAEIKTRMARLTTPIAADDPEARGDVALVMEIRRTVGNIRVLDEWIADLGEQALGFGLTSDESSESSGFNEKGPTADSTRIRRFETRINVYVEWQLKLRVHLANLAKIWISAGFKQRELDLQTTQVLAVNAMALALVVGLGHNPADPEVRAVVHRSLLGLDGNEPRHIAKQEEQ